MTDNSVMLSDDVVRLRVQRLSDAETYVRELNNPYIWQFISMDRPVGELEEKEWIEGLHKRKHTDVVYALEVIKDPPLHIGSMGIHKIHAVDRTAWTGAVIWDQNYMSRGYGTRAKMLLLRYAFWTLNLRKICSSVVAYNERSLNYSLNCGYKVEGRLKDMVYRNGTYWDLVHLGLSREDWEQAWEQYQKKYPTGDPHTRER